MDHFFAFTATYSVIGSMSAMLTYFFSTPFALDLSQYCSEVIAKHVESEKVNVNEDISVLTHHISPFLATLFCSTVIKVVAVNVYLL